MNDRPVHRNVRIYNILDGKKKKVRTDSLRLFIFACVWLPIHFVWYSIRALEKAPRDRFLAAWFITAHAGGSQEAIRAQMAGDRGSKMGHWLTRSLFSTVSSPGNAFFRQAKSESVCVRGLSAICQCTPMCCLCTSGSDCYTVTPSEGSFTKRVFLKLYDPPHTLFLRWYVCNWKVRHTCNHSHSQCVQAMSFILCRVVMCVCVCVLKYYLHANSQVCSYAEHMLMSPTVYRCCMVAWRA